jgi:hypothetical protein
LPVNHLTPHRRIEGRRQPAGGAPYAHNSGVARPLVPEIVDDGPLPRDVSALVRLARLLDAAIPVPGTSRSVGLDPILGLVPVGDVVSAVLSLAIVHGALKYRVPARKVWRMVVNLLLDTAVGAVPVLGDIFDVFYTANLSNAEILVRNRDTTRPPRSGVEVAGVLALVSMAVLGVLAAALFGVAAAIAWALRAVSGA